MDVHNDRGVGSVFGMLMLFFVLVGLAFGIFVLVGGGSGSELEVQEAGGAPVVGDADRPAEGAEQPVAPAEDAERPAEGAEQPVAPAEPAEPADPANPEAVAFASAAGQYRLSETSARAQYTLSAAIHRVDSVGGTILIEPDGRVAGDYEVVWWGTYDNAEAMVTSSYIVLGNPKLQLSGLDLRFEADLQYNFHIVPPDQNPYTNPGGTIGITGIVDPAIGLLEVMFDGQSDGLEFLR